MSPDDIPLLFHTSRRVRREELRNFLGYLTRRVARGRSIACLIAEDAEIRRLNRQYRGKNYAADVLSFSAMERHGVAGDIAISIDRAKAQAAERGHTLGDELRILMLHGALHLAGMDHETDSGEMARAELRWRKRLGLPCGVIERSAGVGALRPKRVKAIQ
jgi:probable rRNA maturation factor